MTVRDRALHVAAILALACPTALAFASGGYFDEARLVALIGAWALVLAAVALGAPVPRRRAAWVALGALAAFTAWVAIAGGWAQLAATARADLERDVLYLGALTAAVLLLGGVRWLVEPVLAAGTVIVVGYALAGRLVPGIVELSATASAGGRLDQPLTYWNAMGALAALGVVLTVRLAGEPLRPRALRVAAAAGAVPLTVGLLLTFSRGALLAAAVGVVLVVLLAPTAAQLRAAACALVPGAVAAFVANRSDAVRELEGGLTTREHQGLVVLAALVVLTVLAAAPAVVGDRPAAAHVARRARAPPRRARRRRRARPRAGRHRAGGLGRWRQGGLRRDHRRGWARRARTAPTTGGWPGRRRATSRCAAWGRAGSVPSGCGSARTPRR